MSLDVLGLGLSPRILQEFQGRGRNLTFCHHFQGKDGKSHNYRIIESLRLEKTSKIIKSNCQPNTTTPAKPYLHFY